MSTTVDREIAAARDLLERYGSAYAPPDEGPVPVEDIAESYLGLLVSLAPLEDGVSGMLLLREREIRVNAVECELWPRRRRFTVAHEIGHWELHAAEVAEGFICRLGDVTESGAKGSPEQLREREANRFAAELLMPEQRVRASVETDGADVVGQADRFEVSQLSMAWRLFNLGYLRRPPKPSEYAAG